jgi:hypothetical protein
VTVLLLFTHQSVRNVSSVNLERPTCVEKSELSRSRNVLLDTQQGINHATMIMNIEYVLELKAAADYEDIAVP